MPATEPETVSAETRAGTGAPYDAELGALFAARGAARVDVPITQPADPYLEIREHGPSSQPSTSRPTATPLLRLVFPKDPPRT